MHKVIASVSLMMCLSASVSAMDYRTNIQRSVSHTVGWEQKNINTKAKDSNNIHAQLKKLEEENEQLRNSISKIAAGNRVDRPKPDTRIQALVEENKRLSILLSQQSQAQKPVITTSSEDVYARKIASLKNENQKLLERVNSISVKSNDGFDTLKAYKEENALLKEALNQRENGAERIVLLQTQIKQLKKVNGDFEKSKMTHASANMKQSKIKEKDAQISSLNIFVEKLQSDNLKLENAVTAENKKSVSYSERAKEATGAYKNNMKALETLKERLAKAQEENHQLKGKIATRSEDFSRSDEQFMDLQKQNQSLRDTIKAQSGSLISSDNASKTAERLLVENSALKQDLELAEKSSRMNGQTAKDTIERSKKLENGIVQRDNYIKKLEGLKDTVSLLREENDRFAQGRSNSNESKGEISELLDQNNDLQRTLGQERENIIAYRTKIKEYQDKISLLKNDSEKNALNETPQSERNSLTALRLENQELKARIDLLSKKNNSVVFQKEASFIKKQSMDSSALLKKESKSIDVEFFRGKKEIIATHEGINQNITEVTYVDTSYPPVNEVRPMLNKDGKHIAGLEDAVEAPSVEDMSYDPIANLLIKSEDLLAQDLNPLSETK